MDCLCSELQQYLALHMSSGATRTIQRNCKPAELLISLRMPGFSCLRCGGQTWRRPPSNICPSCRSSQRGRHNRKPQSRFRCKSAISSAGAPKITPSKVHAKEPELQQESPSAESSSSAAPVQDSDASCYDTMRTQLQQKVLGDLQNLFGLSDAYQVLAVAMTMIDRFQEQKVKFASEACARSLASFAFTCSGVVDEDIKRRQYLDHLVSTHVMSVKDMRTKECWWAMLLPSKGA